MKTRIIRKVLAAMVAAATIASTAGVASAGREKNKKKNKGNVGIITQSKIKEKRKVKRFKRSLGRIKKSKANIEFDIEYSEDFKCEDPQMDMLSSLNALVDAGEFGDAASGVYDLVDNAGARGNLNVAYVLDILDKCSQADNQNAKVSIANSVEKLLFNVNLHGDLKYMVTTILEILQRCANVDDARKVVDNCLDMLERGGLIGTGADLATAQNIRDTLNNNKK